jgi:hypothetical protein
MRRSPSIAPAQPDDVDVYLVLDDFGGRLGRAWRETDEESTDRQTVITDLLDGQYSNPVRVIAFNTIEGWSRDVSEELAEEIAERCARGGSEIPARLEAFIARHGGGWPGQLPLPLRGAALSFRD